MSAEVAVTPSSESATASPAAKETRSAENEAAKQEIAAAAELILTASTDTVIKTTMAKRGYDAAEFARGR